MPRKHRDSEALSDAQRHFYYWILEEFGQEIFGMVARLAGISGAEDEIEKRFWDKVERTLTDPDSIAELRRWSLEFSDENKESPEDRRRVWNYLSEALINARNSVVSVRARLDINDNIEVDNISLEMRGGIVPIIPTEVELISTLNKLRSVLHFHHSYAGNSALFDSDLSIKIMREVEEFSFPRIAEELGDGWTEEKARSALRRFDKFVKNVLEVEISLNN